MHGARRCVSQAPPKRSLRNTDASGAMAIWHAALSVRRMPVGLRKRGDGPLRSSGRGSCAECQHRPPQPYLRPCQRSGATLADKTLRLSATAALARSFPVVTSA
jgi:hypothetical protein